MDGTRRRETLRSAAGPARGALDCNRRAKLLAGRTTASERQRTDRALRLGRRLSRPDAGETRTARRFSGGTWWNAKVLRRYRTDPRTRSRGGSLRRLARQEHDVARWETRHLVFSGRDSDDSRSAGGRS